MLSIIKYLKQQFDYVFGSIEAHWAKYKQKKEAKDYLKSIDNFSMTAKKEGDTEPDESPIFIFSAGWRSGSTLLQRLISSSDNLILWGEPYDRCNIIQTLSDTLSPFNGTWPPRKYVLDELKLENLSDKWIANLYPTEKLLLNSHRQFFSSLFVEPIQKLGSTRWGIKEVRFGLKEAAYLKLLYPNAKFLYLTRDLKEAYTSYKNFSPKMNWYDRWPNKPVFTPYSFAKHRAKLVQEFKVAEQKIGGININYTELIEDPEILNRIDKYCNIKCNRNVLDKKVGNTKGKTKSKSKTNALENILLALGDRLGK